MELKAIIKVRKAISEDLPALSALFDHYRQFYNYPADPELASQYLHVRFSAGESQLLVAARADVLVGFCQLYPTYCSLAAAPYFVLYDLYVDAGARRMGVARALLEAAAAFAREQGADRLELATATDNLAAQRLYESLGWQRDQAFYHYTLPLA